VRGQAMVRGKRRTLVKLVRVDNVTEEIPCNAILAGSSPPQKPGNKVIVSTNGGLVSRTPGARFPRRPDDHPGRACSSSSGSRAMSSRVIPRSAVNLPTAAGW
jgi:hypothetical protein